MFWFLYIYSDNLNFNITCSFGKRVPNTFTIVGNIVDENQIFFHGPWSFSDQSIIFMGFAWFFYIHLFFLKKKKRGQISRIYSQSIIKKESFFKKKIKKRGRGERERERER